MTHFIIAIDGPAASGKGTLARRLAAHFGFTHLDTGLTYRAVAKGLLDEGDALDDEAAALAQAQKLDLGTMSPEVLADHDIGSAASKVAVISSVRAALVQKQKDFAHAAEGAILDGRDIGTVVCPDADIKLYVTATQGIRAGRRFEEIVRSGGQAVYDDILLDIRRRDARDSARQDSPLKPAADAHLLDTSKMDIEAAFLAACALIEPVLAAKHT